MKIGIFTAIERESRTFVAAGATHKQEGMFNVYSLPLGKHEAVLCLPPNAGEICAAAACQMLIDRYHVDCILNFGVVGALTEETSLCSTVLVDSVVHYHMDTSAIDNVPVGRYLCFEDVVVPTNEQLVWQALQVCSLPVVRCASADKFVDSATEKAALHAKFGAHICDMESAGIVFTCRFNNVPCLLVKCISDSLTGGGGEFTQNVEKAAANFFNFAKQLADNLQ